MILKHLIPSYLLIIIIRAHLAIVYSKPVSYNYQTLISHQDLWIVDILLIFCILAYYLGYRLVNKLQFRKRFLRLNKVFLIFVLCLFYLYIISNFYLFFANIFNKSYTGEITRFYENSYTKPLYVIFTLLAFKFLMLTSRFRYLMIGFLLITSIQLIYLDGSRYGFLGFLVMSFIYMREKKFLGVFLISILAIGSINFMFLSRQFLRYGELNMDDYAILSLFSIQAFQYLFEFSLMHFAYVIQNSIDFKVVDLLYSITPIPSSFLNIGVDPSKWRVDVYRPYGGQAEMFAISPLVNIIFFSLLGLLMGMKNSIDQKVSAVKAVLLLFACVASFQYHLRFVQWLLYFILFLEILPTIDIGRSQKIRQ